IVARELGALLRGADPSLPPRSGGALSYTDFARRQADRLAGPEGERLLAFWQAALAGERGPLPDLDLPSDRPRPSLTISSGRGLARTVELPPALTAALGRLARVEGRGATLFTLLAAAWQAQLGRYSGQDDFAVGTPTSGRGA